jgi:protein-S-isoprenylcysteine O-methyltransferase Ste14
MIIEAYPKAIDARTLSTDVPMVHQSDFNPWGQILGSTIMVALMAVVVHATYGRITALLANPSAGLLDYLAEAGTLCFAGLIGLLCVIRLKPSRQAKGFLPIAAALGGSFLLTLVNLAPLTALPGPLKSIAVTLLAFGNVLSVYCLANLGRSFSILPQARKLVTSGPYGIVRHPLYVAEAIAALGVVLLHFNLLTALTGMLLLGLQMRRVIYEESVLRLAFPEYDAYAAQVPRFIPRLPRLIG